MKEVRLPSQKDNVNMENFRLVQNEITVISAEALDYFLKMDIYERIAHSNIDLLIKVDILKVSFNMTKINMKEKSDIEALDFALKGEMGAKMLVMYIRSIHVKDIEDKTVLGLEVKNISKRSETAYLNRDEEV